MVMSDQIIAVLDNICTKFGIVIDWTSENVVPYVTELAGKFITYEIATSVAWCLMLLASMFAEYKFYKHWQKIYHEDEYDTTVEFMYGLSIIVLIVLLFSSVIFIPMQLFDIIECITFPEKAIFEYINRLTNAA